MILAFCVAAREFASMGRRLFSRRLGDIGTRSRLQTDLLCQRLKLDGRNSNGLAGRALPSAGRQFALANSCSFCPRAFAQALACLGCQKDDRRRHCERCSDDLVCRRQWWLAAVREVHASAPTTSTSAGSHLASQRYPMSRSIV